MVAVVDKPMFLHPPCLGRDPRVAVVGLGRTGVSAVRFLHRLGVECLVTDTRLHPPGLEEIRGLEGVSAYTGELRADVLSWATHVLVSPGMPLASVEIRTALEHGVALISDIDLFAETAQAPVIAVTGSNGKSTVTCLVAEMASQAGMNVRAGGNLGTPALDLLDPECQLYVLELSSFQLERTRRLRPVAGTVLNVSPDHLDRHSDLSAYAATKARLLRWSQRRVVNLDDPLVSQLANSCGVRADRPVQLCQSSGSGTSARGAKDADKTGDHGVSMLRFSLQPCEAEYTLIRHQGVEWLARQGETLIPASQVALSGRHNLSNALAALALAEAGGVPLEAGVDALRTFGGLPHRMQTVAEIDGVVWINDSKGTNVGATEAAISGLPGPLILLAGGVGKGADFTFLRQCVAGKVRLAVLFGSDRLSLAAALGQETETVLVEDLRAAMETARQRAGRGDTVLLSPACASLDQFENYQARGNCFESLVRQWQSMN